MRTTLLTVFEKIKAFNKANAGARLASALAHIIEVGNKCVASNQVKETSALSPHS